jgi:hypothetical protein
MMVHVWIREAYPMSDVLPKIPNPAITFVCALDQNELCLLPTSFYVLCLITAERDLETSRWVSCTVHMCRIARKRCSPVGAEFS